MTKRGCISCILSNKAAMASMVCCAGRGSKAIDTGLPWGQGLQVCCKGVPLGCWNLRAIALLHAAKHSLAYAGQCLWLLGCTLSHGCASACPGVHASQLLIRCELFPCYPIRCDPSIFIPSQRLHATLLSYAGTLSTPSLVWTRLSLNSYCMSSWMTASGRRRRAHSLSLSMLPSP